MGRLLIVNGSPRASRSNSRRYIEYFLQNWKGAADQYAAVSGGPVSFELYTDLLLVFPFMWTACRQYCSHFSRPSRHGTAHPVPAFMYW